MSWLVALCMPGLALGATEDDWYTVLLSGQPSGYTHIVLTEADGMQVMDEVEHFDVRRGGQTITMHTVTRFVETLDHRPVSSHVEQQSGSMLVTKDVTFGPDGWALTTTQAGQTHTETVPPPAQPWLTPGALDEAMRGALTAGTPTFSVWTLSLEQGLEPFELKNTVVGRETVRFDGADVPATHLSATMSNLPGVRSESWMTADGTLARSVIDFGALSIEMVHADEATALAKNAIPELMVSTLVRPSRAIVGPRGVRRAVYEIGRASGDDPVAGLLPSGAVQTVSARGRASPGGASSARVTIDLDHPRPPKADVPTAQDLASSSALNLTDPELVALAAKGLEGLPADATPGAKAEALRAFVNRYITTSDLSVGFATASEVARTRQGDCTEHGVLLAALLREAQIPARVASGMVYVERFIGQSGVFGYHMWTQAWIAEEGRWVDLDATLSPTRPFDATHILLGTTSLGDGAGSTDLSRSSALIGSLSVTVVKTR